METTILSMRTFFEVFGWREALDILLITLALFLAYRTFRRLGTWKILAGTLLVAAVFFLAGLLQLRGMGWILSNFSRTVIRALERKVQYMEFYRRNFDNAEMATL